MDELLSVVWHNHNSTFIKSLSCLRKQQFCTDATIACERKFYRVHKLVLSSCSDFFRDLLAWTDGEKPIIVLKDIKYEILEALLDYMYLGAVQIRNIDFTSFLEAAKCLEIKGIGASDMEEIGPETLTDTEPHTQGKTGGNERQLLNENITSSHPAERERPNNVVANPGTKIMNSLATTTFDLMHNQVLIQRKPTKATETQSPETSRQQHNSVVENLNNTQHTTQESRPLDLYVPVLTRAMEDWGCRVKTNDCCSDGSFNIKDCNDGATTGANTVESEGDQKYYLPTVPQQITLSPSQRDTFGNYSIAASSSIQHVEMIDGQIGGSTGSFPREMGIRATTAASISPSSNSEKQKSSESKKRRLVDKQIGFGLKCKVCDKWFPTKSQMAMHERTHTGERPYRCHICPYAATNLENLRRHLASKHEADLLSASRV